eukprot:jgi/Tetstr1/427390/TSEL_017554.t1
MQLEFLDAQACLRLQDCSKDGLLEVPFGDQSRDASYTRLTDEVEELDPNRSRELNQSSDGTAAGLAHKLKAHMDFFRGALRRHMTWQGVAAKLNTEDTGTPSSKVEEMAHLQGVEEQGGEEEDPEEEEHEERHLPSPTDGDLG